MLISAVLCSPIWYLVNDNFPPSGFMAHVPILAAIIGFGFGAIGGLIIGLVVTARGLGKIASVLAGLTINGVLVWLVFAVLYGSNAYTRADVLREVTYNSIGQAGVGMIVGLLISIFSSFMEWRQSQDTIP